MKRAHFVMAFAALAASTLLFPSQIDAARGFLPILVRIDDVPSGPPTVTVLRAPDGYDLYTGPEVANPEVEDGGIITLHGVDTFGTINEDDGGWRFVDPSLPADAPNNATDIVWIQHDWEGTGDLQVGFNTREDGGHYINPQFHSDDSAGNATNRWVTVYSDSTIILQVKARTP